MLLRAWRWLKLSVDVGRGVSNARPLVSESMATLAVGSMEAYHGCLTLGKLKPKASIIMTISPRVPGPSDHSIMLLV